MSNSAHEPGADEAETPTGRASDLEQRLSDLDLEQQTVFHSDVRELQPQPDQNVGAAAEQAAENIDELFEGIRAFEDVGLEEIEELADDAAALRQGAAEAQDASLPEQDEFELALEAALPSEPPPPPPAAGSQPAPEAGDDGESVGDDASLDALEARTEPAPPRRSAPPPVPKQALPPPPPPAGSLPSLSEPLAREEAGLAPEEVAAATWSEAAASEAAASEVPAPEAHVAGSGIAELPSSERTPEPPTERGSLDAALAELAEDVPAAAAFEAQVARSELSSEPPSALQSTDRKTDVSDEAPAASPPLEALPLAGQAAPDLMPEAAVRSEGPALDTQAVRSSPDLASLAAQQVPAAARSESVPPPLQRRFAVRVGFFFGALLPMGLFAGGLWWLRQHPEILDFKLKVLFSELLRLVQQ